MKYDIFNSWEASCSPDEFKRKAMIELVANKKTPDDISLAAFDDVKILSEDVVLFTVQVICEYEVSFFQSRYKRTFDINEGVAQEELVDEIERQCGKDCNNYYFLYDKKKRKIYSLLHDYTVVSSMPNLVSDTRMRNILSMLNRQINICGNYNEIVDSNTKSVITTEEAKCGKLFEQVISNRYQRIDHIHTNFFTSESVTNVRRYVIPFYEGTYHYKGYNYEISSNAVELNLEMDIPLTMYGYKKDSSSKLNNLKRALKKHGLNELTTNEENEMIKKL